jgi:3-oxoacyl-ACP reductase-like protein
MNQTTTNEQLFHTVNTNERGAQDQQEPAQDPVQQQPVPEAAQPPQPAAPAAAAAQQNRPAAGEAAAERDDDWLSLLHNVVSFLVLFSIIYYYSSIERFLVIFTIVLILIL